MPYIQQIEVEDASGGLESVYQACQQRAGYVANILKLQCHEPGILAESLRFYMSLMKSPNALSAARREMLATVVSNVNECFY